MNTKDMVSSIVLISVGGIFAVTSLASLEVGTGLRMGPGYFPLVLSCLIVGIGFILMMVSLRGEGGLDMQAAPARAVAAIIMAPILFGLVVRGAGFIPAVAATAFSASLASPQLSTKQILIIAAGMTAFCVVVFVYGLGLPVRLIGPWLGA